MVKKALRSFVLSVLVCVGALNSYAQGTTTPSSNTPDSTGDTPPVFIYEEEKQIISEVVFQGLSIIDSNILYSAIKSSPGNQLTPINISKDIKSIFEFNFFIDVRTFVEKLEDNKVKLIFDLTEKPQIKEIIIRGAYEMSEDDVREKLSIYKFNMVDPLKINSNMKLLKEEYKSKGLFKTHISYEVEEVSEKWVNLIIIIDENPRTYLTDITITGTKFYYPIDIVRSMTSSEVDGVSFISKSGVFHEQLVNADIHQIYQKYAQEGFIKVKIDKPEIKMIQNKAFARFLVDINITENDRYFTGVLDVQSADEHELIIPKEELLELLTLETDEPYNPFQQNIDRARVGTIYQDRGYAYSQVVVDTKIHEDTKRVDVTYKIYRGEIAYINRIDFSGNLSTMDHVLRRELTIYDNEIYSGSKIRESQSNLIRLGLFSDQGVIPQQISDQQRNEIDYLFHIEEGQTGSLNGTLQYSEQQGFGLGLNLAERNFLGRGLLVNLGVNYTDDQQYSATGKVTEKYIFGTSLTSTTSLSYSFDPTNSDYDVTTISLSEFIAYPFWKNWSWANRLASSRDTYTDANTDGLVTLDNDLVHDTLSYRTGLIYNTVNHPVLPSSGQEAGFFIEQIGGPVLKGDEEYFRADFNYRYFQPLNDENTVVFMAKYDTSHLYQTNPDELIPSTRRLYLGGITTIRGFNSDEIAGASSQVERADDFSLTDLRDSSSDDDDDYNYYLTHRGGIVSRLISLELLFPLTREGENIRGVVFLDVGNVWSEDRMYGITGATKDYSYFRKSYGGGVRFITPMGVIRFEYGNIIDKKPSETPGQLHFTISGLF